MLLLLLPKYLQPLAQYAKPLFDDVVLGLLYKGFGLPLLFVHLLGADVKEELTPLIDLGPQLELPQAGRKTDSLLLLCLDDPDRLVQKVIDLLAIVTVVQIHKIDPALDYLQQLLELLDAHVEIVLSTPILDGFLVAAMDLVKEVAPCSLLLQGLLDLDDHLGLVAQVHHEKSVKVLIYQLLVLLRHVLAADDLPLPADQCRLADQLVLLIRDELLELEL